MGYGIAISTPNVNVNGAKTNQLLLSSKYPFIKLDTQSSISFQTINLSIYQDPPEPVLPATDTITNVYKFEHGLKYTPKIWSLFQVVVPPTTHFYQPYFQEGGVIAAQTAYDGASMYYTADAQYVYIWIDKFNDGTGSPNNLIGTVIKITLFTFVDDFSTT